MGTGRERMVVDDPFDRLSEQDVADACAYADGTLPAARRAEVEARVLASPELTALVRRQEQALAATAALSGAEAPASLRRSVQGLWPRAARRRRWGFALSAAGALAAVVVVVALLAVGGGPAAPPVAAAADLALQPPSGPAPAAAAPGKLAAGVGGVTFPDYRTVFGWRPSGQRSGEIDGRPATVVYYEKGGRRIGYAIVAGAALPLPQSASRTTRGGVQYLGFERGGQQVVTWRQGGHTCVLAGPAPSGELVALASWGGPAAY